jgi:hypothetical protein
VTVRSTLTKTHNPGQPCASEECVIPWNADSALAPRGWQPNPVISVEAAAMCEVDYQSYPHRPMSGRLLDAGAFQNLFAIDREHGRHLRGG